MPSDASLPPNAPMTNGVADSHGEAGASPLPPGSPSTLSEVCADLHTRVSEFLSAPATDKVTRQTQEQVRISIGVIERALRDFGFQHISISYNGGKDCLVLLILYLSVLHKHFTQNEVGRVDCSAAAAHESTSFPTSIPSIYAKPPDPFPAVTRFVDFSTKAYHLDLVHVHTIGKASQTQQPSFKSPTQPQSASSHPIPNPEQIQAPRFTFPAAFAHYLALSHKKSQSITAIFVGTRRTDPHGASLTHFDPTDKNWPSFMRIHPVIDWRLSEIWCFLRADQLRDPITKCRLDYCSMYDEGYTSLGGVGDTLKNPKLKHVDERDGSVKYRPAYEMTEDDEERLGRE